jgi:cell division protein FtsB
MYTFGKLFILGYGMWAGYQIHKYDLIARSAEAIKREINELQRANARAFVEELNRRKLTAGENAR